MSLLTRKAEAVRNLLSLNCTCNLQNSIEKYNSVIFIGYFIECYG
jgi:hypothetical protein